MTLCNKKDHIARINYINIQFTITLIENEIIQTPIVQSLQPL